MRPIFESFFILKVPSQKSSITTNCPIKLVEATGYVGVEDRKVFAFFLILHASGGKNKVCLFYQSKATFLKTITKCTDYKFRSLLNECIRRKWITKSWNKKHLFFNFRNLFDYYNVHAYGDMPDHALERVEIDINKLDNEYLESLIIKIYNDKKNYAYVNADLKVKQRISLKESKVTVEILKLNELKSHFISKLKANLSEAPLVYLKEIKEHLGLKSEACASQHIHKNRFLKVLPIYIDLESTDFNLKADNKKIISFKGSLYEQQANFYEFKVRTKEHFFVTFLKNCFSEITLNPIKKQKERTKLAIKNIRKKIKFPEYSKLIKEEFVNKDTGKVMGRLSYIKKRKHVKKEGKKIYLNTYSMKRNLHLFSFNSLHNCIIRKKELSHKGSWEVIEEKQVTSKLIKSINYKLVRNILNKYGGQNKSMIYECLYKTLDQFHDYNFEVVGDKEFMNCLPVLL